jgi:FMN-dependent NADH-azoreductase
MLEEFRMPTLLHIDSSPRGPLSVSRKLTAEFVGHWREQNPDGKVIYRDVAADLPPAIDLNWVGAVFTPEPQRSPEQQSILSTSDSLVAELQSADHYVFGVPMVNFSVPAAFKLYIDQVFRAGKTFAYSPEGPKGLLTGKKATVIVATGAAYSAGSPFESLDFVVPYLKGALGFIGVTDVQFLTAENMSKVASGKADLEEILAPLRVKMRELAVTV